MISPASSQGARRALLVWAVTATLGVLVLGNVALVLWVRLRQANAALQQRVIIADEAMIPRVRRPRMETAPTASPSPAFERLQDSDVAGRYRFFQDGVELGKITLLPNHSIINKDGTTYPSYHWEIQPGGIMTTWQRGDILLNEMEKPGVYVARKKDGSESLRIEKVEE